MQMFLSVHSSVKSCRMFICPLGVIGVDQVTTCMFVSQCILQTDIKFIIFIFILVSEYRYVVMHKVQDTVTTCKKKVNDKLLIHT